MKKLLSIILTAALLLSLTACSNSESNGGTNNNGGNLSQQLIPHNEEGYYDDENYYWLMDGSGYYDDKGQFFKTEASSGTSSDLNQDPDVNTIDDKSSAIKEQLVLLAPNLEDKAVYDSIPNDVKALFDIFVDADLYPSIVQEYRSNASNKFEGLTSVEINGTSVSYDEEKYTLNYWDNETSDYIAYVNITRMVANSKQDAELLYNGNIRTDLYIEYSSDSDSDKFRFLDGKVAYTIQFYKDPKEVQIDTVVSACLDSVPSFYTVYLNSQAISYLLK